MGSGGPITVPPADKMQIAADGTISILPLGAEKGAEMQVIDKLKLVSPAGSDTLKGLDNLLHVNGSGTLPENMEAKVEVCALEGSNDDMTQALVDIIKNQRSYEVQANLMKAAKNMDEKGAAVLRLPT